MKKKNREFRFCVFVLCVAPAGCLYGLLSHLALCY